MASPFFLDSLAKGGLGLSTSEVGIVYGTIGVGSLLGGVLASVRFHALVFGETPLRLQNTQLTDTHAHELEHVLRGARVVVAKVVK